MDEENKRRKILIIIIIIVFILLVGFLVWWKFFHKNTPVNINNANLAVNTNTAQINTNFVNITANQNTNLQVQDQLELSRLANIFAERYGSFSSESQFQNLADLKKYMTASMQAWADANAKKQLTNANSSGYNSTVTKVITTRLISRADTAAKFELDTQRVEEGSNINGKASYYQSITLELVKQGDDWLVDRATWQPK